MAANGKVDVKSSNRNICIRLISPITNRFNSSSSLGPAHGVSLFVLWSGMPQTVCSGTMFTTPSGFSPHLPCAEPGGEEEEEAPQEGPEPGACLADGPPITSASLDTLIQNLVPTADYYPEVKK